MDAQVDMVFEDGITARNGYRERELAIPVGDIVLRIPKLRAGTYFPEGLIERRSREDRAVAEVVAESWVNGVSTRKMELIARKMGAERLSKYRVSAMYRSLDAEVVELTSRDVCSLLASRRYRAMAGKALQAVFHETDPATVRSAYRADIDAVGAMSARVGALLEQAEADALTYLDFPAEHRRRIRTNNVVPSRFLRTFRQPHRPAIRYGYPSSSVTSR